MDSSTSAHELEPIGAPVEPKDVARLSLLKDDPNEDIPSCTLNSAKFMKEKYKDVFVEQNGKKFVYLGTERERDLFKKIREFRIDNPTLDMYAALEAFCQFESADAIIRALYLSRRVDYIIKFSEEAKFDLERATFERRLVKQGLVLEHESTIDPKETYVKVFIPFHLLARTVEQRNISLPLTNKGEDILAKEETLLQKAVTFFNPEDRIKPKASAPFRLAKIKEFDLGLDEFTPCKGDEPDWKLQLNFFSRGLRNLCTYHIISHVIMKKEDLRKIESTIDDNLDIDEMINKKIYSDFFPLHDGSHKSQQENPNARTVLKKDWALSFTKMQPLDKIREYFGEKYALYFAFLGFYTVWLWSAGIIGVIVFLYGLIAVFSEEGLSFEQIGAKIFDNALTMPYAAFVSIWATMYLEFWKRKNAYLAWWWNVMDYEREETTRPRWYGTRLRKSPITGQMEPHYPDKIRLAKMTTSFCVILIAVAIVLISVMGAVVYQVWSRNRFGNCALRTECDPSDPLYNPTALGCTDVCWGADINACNSTGFLFSPLGDDIPLCQWQETKCVPACSSYEFEVSCILSKVQESDPVNRSVCLWEDQLYIAQVTAALINLLAIVVLNFVFEKIAWKLNDWENHKTQTQYEDALITKTFFFQFLNSYTTLFYIAYFKGTVGRALLNRPELRDVCSFGSCFTELMVQLVIVFLGKQLINQFVEIGLPYILQLFERRQYDQKTKEIEEFYANSIKKYEETKAIDPLADIKKVPQWVKDDRLAQLGTVLFDDFNEMALQFGFITLFVAAFPLAPICALLNNLVEIRTDAYKLCVSYQRPPALQGQDIGSWEKILTTLSAMAVITNAFLVAFTSEWVENVVKKYTGDDVTSILAGRLLIVLLFEHVVFGLKILFAFLIPDVPSAVQIAIERERYLARLALEGIISDSNFEGLDYNEKGKEPDV